MERSRRGMEVTPRESSLARAAERPQKREGQLQAKEKAFIRKGREPSEGVSHFLTTLAPF